MAVVADFAKMPNISDYQTQIADKLKNLDVSILILNAGLGLDGSLVK